MVPSAPMSTAAVLLAAGSGSRFTGSTHKLLAPWGATTVIEAAVSNVSRAGFDEVIVVTGTIDLSAILDRCSSAGPVRVVDNPDAGLGQATSIGCGLAAAVQAGHDVAVIGLGDQPAVTPAIWRAVAETDAPIAVARYSEGWRPPVRLDRSVWDLLPTTGDVGARSLVEARPDLVVEVPVVGDPRDVDRVDDLLTPADLAYVRECLGRPPRCAFAIAARDEGGLPTVIENPPFLADGTPMPTRYWLVDPQLSRRIGTLEAAGGVNRAEAEIADDVLADAHARYGAARDELIPNDHVGPRPSGGVGGTRVGVKCLHTHYAWFLAGGDDPVGRWVDHHLREIP